MRKSPMHDHEVSLSHDRSRFVLQRWWDVLDEIEQTLTTRRNVSAVLNVVGRPVALGRYVVTLIEQRVKSFKHERFVFRFNGLIHLILRFMVREMPATFQLRAPPTSNRTLPPSSAWATAALISSSG